MDKAKWSGNPVCWWLGWYFCFVCLDEMSYTVYYWWLGDAQTTCIKVVSFVWILTILYPLELVLWWSRVLESVLPLQRLRAWPLVRNKDSTSDLLWHSVQISSVAQSYPTLCDPMNHSTPGLPVHHQLPEFTQTHVHRVGDAIQPSHPLSSPFPLAPNPFQHMYF